MHCETPGAESRSPFGARGQPTAQLCRVGAQRAARAAGEAEARMGSHQPLVTQQGGGRAENRAGHPAPCPASAGSVEPSPTPLLPTDVPTDARVFIFRTQNPAAAPCADARWGCVSSHVEKTMTFCARVSFVPRTVPVEGQIAL